MTPIAKKARIVHSLKGRLRVHLPGWTASDQATIEQSVAAVPGVFSAQANHRTGNILIRFNPSVVSEYDLVDHLDRCRNGCLIGWSRVSRGNASSTVAAHPIYRKLRKAALGMCLSLLRDWASLKRLIPGGPVLGFAASAFLLLYGIPACRESLHSMMSTETAGLLLWASEIIAALFADDILGVLCDAVHFLLGLVHSDPRPQRA